MSLLDENLDINISDYYINLAVKYVIKYGLYGIFGSTECVRPAGYINKIGEFVDGTNFNFEHPEKLFIYVFYSVFERPANWLLCIGPDKIGPDKIGPDKNNNTICYKSRRYGTIKCLNKHKTILNLKDIIDEFIG